MTSCQLGAGSTPTMIILKELLNMILAVKQDVKTFSNNLAPVDLTHITNAGDTGVSSLNRKEHFLSPTVKICQQTEVELFGFKFKVSTIYHYTTRLKVLTFP